ncbi:MAG: hypothetical protein ACRD8O_10555 [Bryobacteraceae bacterium]
MAQDPVDDVELGEINYVKEALKWQYNWIGLAGAAAFALVSGTGLPIVLAAGLELMYVALVPQSSRFRRLVRSWKYAEEKRRHEEKLRALYKELTPEIRARYAELEKICAAIRANYERLSSTSQIFAGHMDQKLNGLLNSYLRLSVAAAQHRDYIQMANPANIERELEQLKRSVASDTGKVQEINRKRIEILTKRVERFGNIRENRGVIDAQCEAIEDVLELIRDQSITMSDPQQVSDRLEGLISDVEQTEQNVREIEAVFQFAAPEANDAMGTVMSQAPAQPSKTNSRTRSRT